MDANEHEWILSKAGNSATGGKRGKNSGAKGFQRGGSSLIKIQPFFLCSLRYHVDTFAVPCPFLRKFVSIRVHRG